MSEVDMLEADDPVSLLYQTRAPIMPWVDRIDPVHDIWWKDLVSTGWSEISVYRNDLALNETGMIEHKVRKNWSPITRSDGALYNARAILIMAMLHEWNQMTTFQIATMLGERRQSVWQTMSDLYAAGMVLRLIPRWWDGDPDDSGSGSIWRIDRQSWVTEMWFNQLDTMEWLISTNGVDPMFGSIGSNTPTALRHNLAGVEIVLKALEACPGIAGAWGEAHCNANKFYDASRYELDEARNNVGDAALVLKSGKIIIFEFSGANKMGQGSVAGNKIVEKAAAWTAAVGKSELDISVIFVDIARKPRFEGLLQNVDFGVSKVSEKYASQQSVRRRGAERVFAIDSREWFPISRAVSSSFQRLESINAATGEMVELITPEDEHFTGSDTVINTLAAMHTPWWIHNVPSDMSY